MDDQIVEIIDVEKVLAEIAPMSTKVSEEKLADPLLAKAVGREVLLVDDSSVALNQLRETLSQLGIKTHSASDGLKGLQQLKKWADSGEVMGGCSLVPSCSPRRGRVFATIAAASGARPTDRPSMTSSSRTPRSKRTATSWSARY